MPAGSATRTSRRPYASRVRAERAQETRRRILAAATQLFVECGYAATTIRDVASSAGVSVAGVELAFKTKGELLKVAVDVAIAGDDAPVPMLERAWTEQVRRAQSVDEVLAITLAVLAPAQERSAGLLAVAYEAARGDPSIAALLDVLEGNRSATVAWIVERLCEHAPLRPGLDPQHTRDALWALIDPVLYLRLTASRGWSPAAYVTWLRTSIPPLLLDLAATTEGTRS